MDEKIPYANFTILHFHVMQLLEFPPKQILFPTLNSQIQENKNRIISSIQNLGLWNNFKPTFKLLIEIHHSQMCFYFETSD
jgi:hypothetical protein